METTDILGNTHGRIHEIQRKILELKDRLVREADRDTREIMVSVIMELEEFSKMLQAQAGRTVSDTDLLDMEKTIYSGRLSFKEAFKNAGGMLNTNSII
jgi:hypothetical protein